MALADPAPALYGRRPADADPAALVRAHLPLVRRIAWHVHGRVSRSVEVEELVGIGMVALVEAAGSWEDRGHAFATYAALRIRGAMIDHLRRHATLCRSAMGRRRELEAARGRLARRLGREPGEAELAAEMGLPAADFRRLADDTAALRHDSLDELYSDQSMWFADLAEGADEALARGELQARLAAGIGGLPQREQLVLQLYFTEELNLEEIGQVLGVGAARVCQIKKAALDRLRAALRDGN